MFDIESVYSAKSADDAIRALARDPEAVLIAGGSDVLIKVREGRLAGRRLVSVHGLEELKGVAVGADGAITIGALCTFDEVTQSAEVQAHIPALGYAAAQAGGPQLRNMGTIGGNVCNGATSADTASTLLALNARLVLRGPGGGRLAALADFYRGPGSVDLRPAELLTAIRIERADYDGFFGCYIKYAQRSAMDIATLGCAVQVKLDAEKRALAELRLAFGVATPTPVRCRDTEARLAGAPLAAGLAREAGEGALGEVSPRTSWRATREFRRHLVRELTARALRQAVMLAGGELP